MDLSSSVIMPREDFIELTTCAFNQPPTSPAERVAVTLQTTIIFAGIAAAFSGATYVWYRLMSKLESEKTENEITVIDARANSYKQQ